jgi:hypothetical protein
MRVETVARRPRGRTDDVRRPPAQDIAAFTQPWLAQVMLLKRVTPIEPFTGIPTGPPVGSRRRYLPEIALRAVKGVSALVIRVIPGRVFVLGDGSIPE